nr:hypothetical protein [Saprospiraceae bacterium]
MKIRYIIYNIILATVLMVVPGCSLTDLNVNEDPNNPSTAASNLLLSNIEVNLMSNFAANEGDAAAFMGLMGTQGLSRYDLS